MKKRTIKILIALVIYIIAFLLPFQNIWNALIICPILYLCSYCIVGIEIVWKAMRNLLRGKLFDENFLMTIATLGAFAIGEFPEAVAVMLFYQVGELFQSYAVDKSRKSISSLMDIRPDFANVKRDNKITKVNPEEVKLGEIIIVKPGEKIPLDGIIVEGHSLLDTSSLTGESLPREVHLEDEVLSGCINQNGLLSIKVTKEFGESTVSKILNLVENASSKKSKSENFISKFAKYYTPTVVIIALLLAIIPPLFLGFYTFTDWLYRALSFLVVSCPCALVISIPLSFFGGIGGASRIGILVKGSNYLEALAHTEIIVFDKTGTLTEGTFEVQKIEAIDISQDELLKLTAHAESFSNHPISISLKKAYDKEINSDLISETKELSGLGIESVIEGKNILVGNEKLMEENHISYTKCNEIGTILYVAIEKTYAGFIVIADKIKKDAKQTITTLKSNHIKQTIMLTGDKKVVGENVASKLGIDTVYSELLPSGKAEKLEEIMKNSSPNGNVAFVGDGINDAPVLALADIGIAMGGLGADSAIEAADIVIMTDEPSKINHAIQLSKKTMRIVKENIIFAIFIKIAVLLLSAIGLSTMWEAVFADVGVSVIAILNALRVLKNKEP
ncbi:MAG: cadmium-translocating P-type ATPase [Clostridia bacterium]|nr:cadmium-translocating P-type ATPase [Clostridia bacterium]